MCVLLIKVYGVTTHSNIGFMWYVCRNKRETAYVLLGTLLTALPREQIWAQVLRLPRTGIEDSVPRQRGTTLAHLGWTLCLGILDHFKGRTGTAIISAFVKFLKLIFRKKKRCKSVAATSPTSTAASQKDHDAVDVGLGEYVCKDATAPLLATYRLLSKSSPPVFPTWRYGWLNCPSLSDRIRMCCCTRLSQQRC